MRVSGESGTSGESRTVAVAGVDFGWGSSGKLSAVLTALQAGGERSRFVGLASGLGRPVLAGSPVERWFDLPEAEPERGPELARIVREQRVAAALVVLDGGLARALGDCGVPVVFVDSLPFLWTEGDRAELPLDAEVYCAQRCVDLPPECTGVLADVRRLRWVDAVIAGGGADRRAAPGRRPRRALVSLGGLRAPQLDDWASYPQLVLPAALEALAASGFDEVHVAGNLPAWLAGQLVDSCPVPAATTVGALAHEDFLHRLAECDVLLASPGLTTLLEAGRLAVPTVCLPPQNLSQIFNGRFYERAVGGGSRVVWPKEVFAEDEALALRVGGEGRALDLIYGGIARAAQQHRRATSAAVRGLVAEALGRVEREPGTDWGALTAEVGTGGAAQVAEALVEVLGATGPAR